MFDLIERLPVMADRARDGRDHAFDSSFIDGQGLAKASLGLFQPFFSGFQRLAGCVSDDACLDCAHDPVDFGLRACGFSAGKLDLALGIAASSFENGFDFCREKIAGIWRQQFVTHQAKDICLCALAGEPVAIGTSGISPVEVAGAAIGCGTAHHKIAAAFVTFEQAGQQIAKTLLRFSLA